MREIIEHYRPGIDASTVLAELEVEPGGYFVASAHREENVDAPDRLARLLEALAAVAERWQRPVLFSTHPRTRQRLAALEPSVGSTDGIRFLEPLGFLDYVRLQTEAFCVLSDSGSLTEEASLLGFRAVTLREAHERPEGMDEATVLMSGLGAERVVQAVEMATAAGAPAAGDLRVVDDYRANNVSRKVARIILSYVDYVNAVVWRKPV